MSPSPCEQRWPSHLDTTDLSRDLPSSVDDLHRAGVCQCRRGWERVCGPQPRSSKMSQSLVFRSSAADWQLDSIAGDTPWHRASLSSCGWESVLTGLTERCPPRVWSVHVSNTRVVPGREAGFPRKRRRGLPFAGAAAAKRPAGRERAAFFVQRGMKTRSCPEAGRTS